MQNHPNSFSSQDLQGIAEIGQMMIAVKTGQMTIAAARAKAQALLDDPTTSLVMQAQARMVLNILDKMEAHQ